MSAKNSKIARRTLRNYEIIVEHKLAGRTNRQIADLLSKDEKQIRRWIAEPEFIALFETTKKTLHRELVDTIAGAGRDALRLLAGMVTDPTLTKKERESAAKYLLDLQIKFNENAELAALNERLGKLEGGGWQKVGDL
jgi:hypothetical protein